MSARFRAERQARLDRRIGERLDKLERIQHMTRTFESATGQDWRPHRGRPSSADAVNQHGATRVMYEARYADENDGTAIAVLDDLLDNIVGSGRPVEPMVRRRDGSLAVRTNEALRNWWDRFWAQPDTTGEYSGDDLEATCCRTWLRDGEGFGVLQFNPPRSELPHSLGLLIEALEPDYVPYHSNAIFEGMAEGAAVVHGVERNRWRRPLAYHVLNSHPADVMIGNSQALTRRIPAGVVVHPKFRRRLHSTRGVSVLHAVLPTLQDIRESWDSERIAMRIAAAMTAYIKRNDVFGNHGKVLDKILASRIGANSFDLAPGMVWENLLPGEEVGVIGSDRPNQNFDPFTNALHRFVAGGTGTKHSSITKRYDGNYSAQRQELVESAVGYRRAYCEWLTGWKLPIYRAAVDTAILTGAVAIREAIDPATLYHADIPPPSLPWIDQQKEINAYVDAIEAKLIARHQAIRELGRDPRAVDRMIEEEQARLDAAAAAAAPVADGPPPGDGTSTATNPAPEGSEQ